MAQVGSVVQPRGWYHGWTIVAVCILSQATANGLTYNAFSLFLRGWSSEFHAPISQLQLSLSAMGLVTCLLSPFVGMIADKYPARWMFACGLVGMSIFFLGISFATRAWHVLALYGFVASLSLGLCTSIPANALISRWFVRRLGLALGLCAFGIGFAGVVLPPVIAVLMPAIGWRMIWRGGGLLVAFIVFPLAMSVIRNRPGERDGSHYLSGDSKSSNPHGHSTGSNQLRWRDVLARRNFLLLLAIYLPLLGLHGGVQQNLPPYAAQHGLSQQSGALLISVLSFSQIVATLGLGLLSDRIGNRLPFAGLAVMEFIGAMLLVFGTGMPVIALGCALVGAGGGLFTLLAAAIAVEFGAEGVGRAFGLSMLFLPVMGLAPFVVAKLQEK